MILWFTGNSGAGKTTLAKSFQEQISNSILLDGDDLRKCWNLKFSRADRVEQNERVMKLAAILEHQGFTVLIAVICPYLAQRLMFEKFYKVKFIRLRGGKKPSEEYPYEI